MLRADVLIMFGLLDAVPLPGGDRGPEPQLPHGGQHVLDTTERKDTLPAPGNIYFEVN